MKKVPLILWSGGLDSTYLLWDRLSNGYIVDVLYVALSNNDSNNKREEKARNKLRKILDKADYSAKIRMEKYHYIPEIKNNTLQLPQPLLWNEGMVLNYNKDIHTCVEIGYVKGDDFWHFRDKISEYQKLMFKVHHEVDVSIDYPLEWISKATIIDRMSEDETGKQLLDNIRYCEDGESKDPCGQCPSCIKHEEALYTYNKKKKK